MKLNSVDYLYDQSPLCILQTQQSQWEVSSAAQAYISLSICYSRKEGEMPIGKVCWRAWFEMLAYVAVPHIVVIGHLVDICNICCLVLLKGILGSFSNFYLHSS